MQKFIFNKNSLPISIRSRLTPTDLQQLPELFLLEGELLEGGTVEKCCDHTYTLSWMCKCPCHKVEKNQSHDKPCCYHQSCGCSCHNKKEEGYKWLDIKIEAKGKDFDREKKEEWERLFDLNYHDKEKLKILFAQAIDGKFNRETPKECPSDHVMKDGKCAVTDGFIKCVCKCSFCSAGEEVKLPEKLSLNDTSLTYYGQMDLIENRFNELLRYTLTQRADYVFSAKVDSEPQERDYMLE